MQLQCCIPLQFLSVQSVHPAYLSSLRVCSVAPCTSEQCIEYCMLCKTVRCAALCGRRSVIPTNIFGSLQKDKNGNVTYASVVYSVFLLEDQEPLEEVSEKW